MTAVESDDLFVDCGPALFNRPVPLLHATCASAHFPLPAVSIVLIAVGFVGVAWCFVALARRAISNTRSP